MDEREPQKNIKNVFVEFIIIIFSSSSRFKNRKKKRALIISLHFFTRGDDDDALLLLRGVDVDRGRRGQFSNEFRRRRRRRSKNDDEEKFPNRHAIFNQSKRREKLLRGKIPMVGFSFDVFELHHVPRHEETAVDREICVESRLDATRVRERRVGAV